MFFCPRASDERLACRGGRSAESHLEVVVSPERGDLCLNTRPPSWARARRCARELIQREEISLSLDDENAGLARGVVLRESLEVVAMRAVNHDLRPI